MNIQPTNNLHFEGKLIAPTVVKQKVNKKWKDMPVNFVKFHAGDKFDRLSINFLSYLWNGGKNLSGAIAEEVSILKVNLIFMLLQLKLIILKNLMQQRF